MKQRKCTSVFWLREQSDILPGSCESKTGIYVRKSCVLRPVCVLNYHGVSEKFVYGGGETK